MELETHYLNTDLDLMSAQNLKPLAAVLEAQGMMVLHVDQHHNGLWHAALETGENFDHPDANSRAILSLIEALQPPERALWEGCAVREFDVGYECGSIPRGFNQALAAGTLARMAALGVSLRVTLYPATPNPPLDGSSD